VTRTGDRATPVLATARLRLRARRVDDAEAMHPAFVDRDAMRYWSGPPHRDLAETIADFSRPAAEWRAWSITLAGDDRAIGFVAAGEKRQGKVSEVGYMLMRSHWGHGLAAEALAVVIDQLLIAEGQRRVFADTDPDNRASRRLLERLGFRLEGILRAEWETHIGVRDTALYGLLSEEWKAAKARG
jgi:[ribosomal protein S5]-alanine N-acetyltransferase